MKAVLRLPDRDRSTPSRSSPCRGGSAPSSPRIPVTAHNTDLIVNGVVGEADVWVNGTEVATRDTVQGAYTRYTFDVTRLAAPRRQHARARGLSEQPEHDVHARQRRLDADPARQQHRLPVPDPAAHRRARSPCATRTSSRTTRADLSTAALTLKARRHQPRAHAAQTGDRLARRSRRPPVARSRVTQTRDGRRRRRRRPSRSPPATTRACASTTRASGGPTGWARSRCTACSTALSQRGSATRLAVRDVRHPDGHHAPDRRRRRSRRRARASSSSTACRSCSAPAAGPRTCSCATRHPIPPIRSR